MSLGDDLDSEVRKIFREAWTVRAGRVVPESDDLKLNNDAVTLEGTVLYADLDGSTKLVDSKNAEFAAEIYKTYLVCAARIIRAQKGEITAYDGDRIMAVYIGDRKNSNAAITALKINYAVTKIINPAIADLYPKAGYKLRQSVGIDTCKLFIARTGIRGSNDLVWVGRAANYAAKLSDRSGPPSQITKAVYDKLAEDAKLSDKGQPMWTKSSAPEIGNKTIYTSDWTWKV